jgi:hypothetical protein
MRFMFIIFLKYRIGNETAIWALTYEGNKNKFTASNRTKVTAQWIIVHLGHFGSYGQI